MTFAKTDIQTAVFRYMVMSKYQFNFFVLLGMLQAVGSVICILAIGVNPIYRGTAVELMVRFVGLVLALMAAAILVPASLVIRARWLKLKRKLQQE